MIRLDEQQRLVPEVKDTDWLGYSIPSQTLPISIAPEDYVDPESGRRYFTWDEIMRKQKKGELPLGWRLPTKEELEKLVVEFSAQPEADSNPSSAFIERLYLTPNGWIIPERLEKYAKELELSNLATSRGGSGGLCAFWTSSIDMERERQYLLRGYRSGGKRSFYEPSIFGRYAYILAATRCGKLDVTTFPADHGLTIRLVYDQ